MIDTYLQRNMPTTVSLASAQFSHLRHSPHLLANFNVACDVCTQDQMKANFWDSGSHIRWDELWCQLGTNRQCSLCRHLMGVKKIAYSRTKSCCQKIGSWQLDDSYRERTDNWLWRVICFKTRVPWCCYLYFLSFSFSLLLLLYNFKMFFS